MTKFFAVFVTAGVLLTTPAFAATHLVVPAGHTTIAVAHKHHKHHHVSPTAKHVKKGAKTQGKGQTNPGPVKSPVAK